MRTILIRLFALDYFINYGKGFFNIPRITIWSFITFAGGALFSDNNDTISLIFWILFGIGNGIALFYFKYKPLTYIDLDMTRMTLSQAYLWSYFEVYFKGNKELEILHETVEKDFKAKYGEFRPKTDKLITIVSYLILMILLAFFYMSTR